MIAIAKTYGSIAASLAHSPDGKRLSLWSLLLAFAVGFFASVAHHTAFAQEEETTDPFANERQFPWFDRDSGQLIPPEITPGQEPINDPVEPGNRDSDWVSQPTSTAPTSAAGAAASAAFSGILQVVFIAFLAIVVALVLALLVWAFFRPGRASISVPGQRAAKVGQRARFEELPEPLRREEGDLLAAARRCYEAGDYAEAIVYLFSYELIELDRNQVIRLSLGKTNRQYLRETGSRPTLASILDKTIVTFEDAFFGRYEIDRDRFESCWRELDRFQSELQTV